MKKILLKALPLVLLFVSTAIRAELHPIRRNRVQKTGIRFLADIRRRNTIYAQGCSLFFRERRTTSAPGASCIHFGSGNSDKDIGLRRQACRERSLRSPRLLERCKQLLFPPSERDRLSDSSSCTNRDRSAPLCWGSFPGSVHRRWSKLATSFQASLGSRSIGKD